MYLPLELPSTSSFGNRRPTAGGRFWSCWSNFGRSATSFANKPSDRRRGNSLISSLCHLPLLILWTLIVIIVLHKLTSNTTSDTLTTVQQQDPLEEFSKQHPEEWREPTTSDNDVQQTNTGQFVFNQDLKSTVFQRKELIDVEEVKQELASTTPISRDGDGDIRQQPGASSTSESKPTTNKLQQRTTSQPLLTTKKSTTSDFARQSKVFILIVQDESFYHRMSLKRDVHSAPSPSNLHATANNNNDSDNRRPFRIPNHIRLLMNILDSHRIGYDIDTTQFGLPVQLLADRESKLFSVIIIDNFFKYTKLNRWVRDQLDRHCRLNEVGVVTYLRHVDDLLDSNDSQTFFKAQHNHHLLSQRSVHSSSSTTAKTMTDEFPLIIKPIKQDCRNSSNNCLIDYEVSDTTPMLRILKRKSNFILPGELDPNQSPWTTISSNHITYEPITWAKFRKSPATRVVRQAEQNQHNVVQNLSHRIEAERADYSTQSNNQEWLRNREKTKDILHKRNAIQSSHRMQIANLLDKHQLKTTPGKHDDEEPLHGLNHSPSSATELSNDDELETESQAPNDNEKQILSMLDRGLYDGIKRIIFGFSNEHWLNRILVLDAIEHLSSGRIISPLDRFIQIDIDDIFVGEKGIRLTRDDVDNLVASQRNYSQVIDGGFKFNLGFSGKYFKHGHDEENLGDEALIARAREFTWFCHFWSHSKAHLFNDTEGVANELRKNLEFARAKQLPLIGQSADWFTSSRDAKLMPTYAVAPHHSGVYPIHEQLYEAWREVLNVRVTSTEEYPHLRPASGRRAFVHKTITVLPRQTCGLYTHTIYRHKYPGGFNKLLANIRGGELFQTVLHNPVNIYMTHMSNYAHDRLAPLAFNDLFNFVKDNTNLQLKFWPSGAGQTSNDSRDSRAPSSQAGDNTADGSELGPMKLAQYHLSLYPNEREPLWTNPCDDKRHLAIWSQFKQDHYCPIVPRLLVVGPQKTGTTALYSFLKINPIFRSSPVAPAADYEEIQFFNEKHYRQGIDWYFEKLFSSNSNSSGTPTKMIDDDGGGDHDADEQPLDANELPEWSAAATASGRNSLASGEHYYFDKSATYFDDPKVARRASSLVPGAKVIILLINPIDRAHSWFQHMRAHGDEIANLVTFEQLMIDLDETIVQFGAAAANEANKANDFVLPGDTKISLNASQLHQAIALRNRCLQPGYYARHLINWLDYFPSRQIIIIDGEWFKYNPAAVMNRLQLLLRVPAPHRLDYNEKLVFVKQKGFYCEKVPSPSSKRANKPSSAKGNPSAQSKSSHKCLGVSKGRKYPPMSHRVRSYLQTHYRPINRQLARLLSDIGQPLPNWLHASDDGESQLI